MKRSAAPRAALVGAARASREEARTSAIRFCAATSKLLPLLALLGFVASQRWADSLLREDAAEIIWSRSALGAERGYGGAASILTRSALGMERGQGDAATNNVNPAPSQNRTAHPSSPSPAAAFPIHLVDPSAGQSVVLSWEALAARWDRHATFDDLTKDLPRFDSPQLPVLPPSHRIIIIIHCAPKMGSLTLRTACRDNLQQTCGIDPDDRVDPTGYSNSVELAKIVGKCTATHHFCQRRGLLKATAAPLHDVTFLHLYPFRNYDEWTASALKQPYDRGGEPACDRLRELMDDCEDKHGELSFKRYPKAQMSEALPMAVRRIRERKEGHHAMLYPFREVHRLLEMLSEAYRIPVLPGSNGTDHVDRPRNGTCDGAILDRFHECFTAGLTELP